MTLKEWRYHALVMLGAAGSSLLAVGIGVGIAFLTVKDAWPHDAIPTAAQPLGWNYPWSCCSSQDCSRADNGISETPDGYVVRQTGELVPYRDKRIKDSPDGEFHWCAHRAGIDAGKTICLFVPPKGF